MHHGFYSAYHNTTIRPGVLSAIKRANEMYGDLKVIVTGHSMGGAMATFCGLDLAVIIHKPILIQLSLCVPCSEFARFYFDNHNCFYGGLIIA